MGVISIYTTLLCMILATYGLVLMIADILDRIKARKHQKKANARIIAQAKASGDWDRKPLALGGRALDLKVWEDFKIKREPGETDAELRRRYMKEHNKIEAYIKKLREQMGAALQIPTNILYGGETVTSTIEKSEDE